MPRYVIERNLPGAGTLDPQQLRDISKKSNDVLAGMSQIEWVESYVTDDKLFCVYDAAGPQLIEAHARDGGFPCDAISEVKTMISPQTGR
ncbi:MAG: DUF4242 domain-containing protein [Dermatophilaceae bacterium]